MTADPSEHKCEVVTLHLPFRNEENEIITERKSVKLYEDNDVLIMERKLKFESNSDIAKTIQICQELCIDKANEGGELSNIMNLLAAHVRDRNPYADFLVNANADANTDLNLTSLYRPGPVAKKRNNIMDKEDFNHLMRLGNHRQKGLLLHVI